MDRQMIKEAEEVSQIGFTGTRKKMMKESA